MAVAKKDQERVGYAWLYGAQARKDGKEQTEEPTNLDDGAPLFTADDLVSAGQRSCLVAAHRAR